MLFSTYFQLPFYAVVDVSAWEPLGYAIQKRYRGLTPIRAERITGVTLLTEADSEDEAIILLNNKHPDLFTESSSYDTQQVFSREIWEGEFPDSSVKYWPKVDTLILVNQEEKYITPFCTETKASIETFETIRYQFERYSPIWIPGRY